MKYSTLLSGTAAELRFGSARFPVECGFGVQIGSGQVLPEVNFTLPEFTVNTANLDAILGQYRSMAGSVLDRLVELKVPAAVLEFEHTPQMTWQTEIGAAITAEIKRLMREAHEKHGFRSALRVTVCDIRDGDRPPPLRSGEGARLVSHAFERSAIEGADLLSIESTGGKEVSDRALTEVNIEGLLFALGVLAPRDMAYLWSDIVRIAEKHNIVAAGDTACAFANTAMVLADQHFLPQAVAVVVRAMSAVRSLVAYEVGAVGPSKDCGYEGPVIKAITGTPISMEGKSSACAHFSHVGNVAAACCDLWSNESVQNVKLLSGFAPEVCAEMLAYDCRLMNAAIEREHDGALADLFTRSDVTLNAQALVISPNSSLRIARAIVASDSHFNATRAAGLEACNLVQEALTAGELELADREKMWLDRIEDALTEHGDEGAVIESVSAQYAGLFAPEEYGL